MDNGTEWSLTIATDITIIILSILVCTHAIRMYEDFFTVERKSIQHRRKTPNRTKSYYYAGWCTITSIICYLMTNIWNGITYQVAVTNQLCAVGNCVAFGTLHFSKLFMYFVFFIRLEMIYGESNYGYRSCTLVASGIVLTIITMSLIVFEIVVYLTPVLTKPGDFLDYDDGEDDLYFCEELFEDFSAAYLVAIIYILFDLVMNITYAILFIIPLKKTIKLVRSSSRDLANAKKVSQKMLAVASKVGILTVTLCVSSIGAVLCTLLLALPQMFAIDFTINVLCLMLMTPYYDDQFWYSRLCCCCIRCCDKSGYSTREQDKPVNNEEPINSVDTMDVVQLAANTNANSGDRDEKNLQELVQVAPRSQSDTETDNNGDAIQ